MKTFSLIVLFIVLAFSLTSSAHLPFQQANPVSSTVPAVETASAERSPDPSPTINPINQDADSGSIDATPEPELPADLFPDLYGCRIAMTFLTGPLAGNASQFSVLDQSYFFDKADKFNPGKNTAVYYQDPRYIILHSSYYNRNMLKPLEAEFLRFYLEYWGDAPPAYIQTRIDGLVGSQVTWVCDDELMFETEISDIVRLSEEASTRLWLEPEKLDQILYAREGIQEEWVGQISSADEDGFYVGFCSWGPRQLGEDRFDTYRYLVHFTPID